ncbi:ENTH/ANTH/VHS superfamily protein [Actinidia rufa]|uniref:ENTH/ANTH/VHS superfamily protein n=1 Tax=Actinidia rufa TaxID=165716 RepID=A0A7J0EM35_9ERIC|nr:ENTH/ANTH/VHS superfamily protein [Actinidia rufa]
MSDMIRLGIHIQGGPTLQTKHPLSPPRCPPSNHPCVLRAPEDVHLQALLSLGDASRATASALVESLMARLRRTGDAVVAIKCLLIIHQVIRRGPFILQDQLSLFRVFGGRNYLNLSAFSDGATAATLAFSAWVRWYARYLETLLSTSRTLGFFLCSSSSTLETENQVERISSLMNVDLIRDVDSLVALIEEICKVPDHSLQGNRLLSEVMGLVDGDYLSTVNEAELRLSEFRERLSQLSFGDPVKLMCELKRLEGCRERVAVLFSVKKASVETLWGLVGELKDSVGVVDVCRERGRVVSLGWRDKGSESARFDERVVKYGGSVKFSSGRFGSNKLSLMAL